MRALATLPKAHLHLHLEGGMRPKTLQELADHYGMPVPETRGFGSFVAFADMYLAACQVLRTPDDLRRLIDETADDALADGAVWVEPAFYAPFHVDRLGPVEGIVELVLDAAADAARRTGVGMGIMLNADRTADPVYAVAQARLAARYADRGIVSFGLANNETGFPPAPFAEAYAIAKDAGLLSTPHAGELDGPDSVRDALDLLHADRIQHGIRAIEEPALVERLAAERVCLDVCPSSNLALGVVPSLAEHPLPQLLDAGVPCSLNGDDPLLFGPGLLDEYELVREGMGVGDEQLAAIAKASIESSGAPADVKARGVTGVEAWLAA